MHSLATILYENGADIKQVADDLRHATIQMAADRYTHTTLKSKQPVQGCIIFREGFEPSRQLIRPPTRFPVERHKPNSATCPYKRIDFI